MLKDASGPGAASAGPVVAVDAGSIPASDRFGWWSDMVGHEVMPVSIHSAHSGRFQVAPILGLIWLVPAILAVVRPKQPESRFWFSERRQ
ncbi:hypothetical protein ABZ353_16190 [Streptomyces niveus]|uniref:hypothetical protein n=1 Tax=Streptomyces niveus TaxID=193462 RepID=UPI00340198BE